MKTQIEDGLTQRQRNERDYHREHATSQWRLLQEPFSFDVLDRPARRWWNAYWHMYSLIESIPLRGSRALVVGCGFGEDALRLARLGAEVHAFDLSRESLEIADALARREGLEIEFAEMPAEALAYDDSVFDFVLARDILHHVDIPRSLRELVRVSRPGARYLLNEIYSHSSTERLRRSRFVEQVLYPRMRRFIYGTDRPYITQDERKLTEADLDLCRGALGRFDTEEYFNFIVNRILPDRFDAVAQLDRGLLKRLSGASRRLGGRVLITGTVAK